MKDFLPADLHQFFVSSSFQAMALLGRFVWAAFLRSFGACPVWVAFVPNVLFLILSPISSSEFGVWKSA